MFFFIETFPKHVDTIGWGNVEVDVLEVEQNREPDTGKHEVTASKGSNTEQKDAGQEAIVLEVDVIHQEQAGIGQEENIEGVGPGEDTSMLLCCLSQDGWQGVCTGLDTESKHQVCHDH